MKLVDVAQVIRSKNADPFKLTFDIVFIDATMHKKIWKAGVINRTSFAKLYNVEPETVLRIINVEAAKAIKINMLRPLCAGNLGDQDVLGVQQYSPLLAFEFELND